MSSSISSGFTLAQPIKSVQRIRWHGTSTTSDQILVDIKGSGRLICLMPNSGQSSNSLTMTAIADGVSYTTGVIPQGGGGNFAYIDYGSTLGNLGCTNSYIPINLYFKNSLQVTFSCSGTNGKDIGVILEV